MKSLITTLLLLAITLSLSVHADAIDDCFTIYKTKEWEKAYRFCKPLAEQGDGRLQLMIGTMYHGGDGVPKNIKEAVKWYRLAAEQGIAQGQHMLGVMFYEGAVVEQNYKEAVKWHRLAAEQGHAGSINNLGVCYGQGKGLIVNYKEAARLYEQSARKGYALGMMNIAQMYESGVGVEEDKIYAYMWFDLANEAGHSSAKDKREELSEKMTIQELHFAQEISRMMTMIKNSNRE